MTSQSPTLSFSAVRALVEDCAEHTGRPPPCLTSIPLCHQDTSRERGTDDLDFDVFDVRPRQEPKNNQNQVQETSERRRELRRHSPPLNNQRPCGQKSYDPKHVSTKPNADEHVVACVASTQKGRQATHDAPPVYNDLTSWWLNQGRFNIP